MPANKGRCFRSRARHVTPAPVNVSDAASDESDFGETQDVAPGVTVQENEIDWKAAVQIKEEALIRAEIERKRLKNAARGDEAWKAYEATQLR